MTTNKYLKSIIKKKTNQKRKEIIHNFVNPHMQIKGKTPAEVAGIDLKLGRRKLLNLIKYRAKTKMTIR